MQVVGARRDGLAFDLAGKAGIEIERVAGGGDVGAHFRNGVAGIDDLDAQNLVGLVTQLLRQLPDELGALLRLDGGPGRMRRLRRSDRMVDV